MQELVLVTENCRTGGDVALVRAKLQESKMAAQTDGMQGMWSLFPAASDLIRSRSFWGCAHDDCC